MDSRPRRPNVFAGPYLDRHTQLRERTDWLAERLRHPFTRLVAVWESRNLFRREPFGALLLEPGDDLLQSADLTDAVFLGEHGEHNYFLIELASVATGSPAAAEPPAHPVGEFKELRFFGAVLPQAEAGLLAYARALAIWRSRHRFCGVCGSPTRSRQAGHVLVCTNESCRTEQFPRLDPAIIVLVTDGERAL